MKKIIAVAAFAASLVASSAFAKTEGHFVGISLLKSSATNRFQDSGKDNTSISKFDDESYGVGVNYRHAFNFNGFFVAPGVFFDHLGLESTDQNGGTVTTNSRYGSKLDLGYDINERIAAYVTNGLSSVKYRVNMPGVGINNDSKLSYYYGAGIAAKITKNLFVNVEYTTQTVNMTAAPGAQGLDHIKSKIDIARIGLAYNF